MFRWNKILFLTITISAINAYEFSFFNKTEDTLAVAIQFTEDEGTPYHKQLIKPGARGNFVPGKYNISDIEWGSCLKNVFYAKNPTIKERMNYFKKTVWRKVPITWITAPLESAKQPQKKLLTKKQEHGTKRIITKKKKAAVQSEKSLCKDRHFEFTQDGHGTIVLTGSLSE